ncbi:cyclodeaminase/cyclohydrolase family protein [Thermovenabulum sp.]|uniref:cyclodeaminase/cyclohydrolase family protein n=1 Tax=Thermovenabulum sp. TaxID=3100335 RepID=UPI003C7DC4F0
MKFQDYKISDFLEELSSKSPAPGGGTASALLGAVGMSLFSMACNLTLGKEKFKPQEETIKEFLKKAQSLLEDFRRLMDEDTEAFNEVAKAYKMPKDSEEEKKKRKEAIQEALKKAASAPLKMMEKVKEASELITPAVSLVNPAVITDLGVCVLSLKSALFGAWLNVKINLNSIEDEKFKASLSGKMMEYLKVSENLDKLFEEIQEKLD